MPLYSISKRLFIFFLIAYESCFGNCFLLFSCIFPEFLTIFRPYENFEILFAIQLCCKGSFRESVIIACMDETVIPWSSIFTPIKWYITTSVRVKCSFATAKIVIHKILSSCVRNIIKKAQVFWLCLICNWKFFNKDVHCSRIAFQSLHHRICVQLFSPFCSLLLGLREVYEGLEMSDRAS